MIGHTSWNVWLHAIFTLNKTNAVASKGSVQCYCQGQKALVNIVPNIGKQSISEKSHHIWVYSKSLERLKHDIIGLLHLVCKMEKERHYSDGSHSTHELDTEEWQLCFALITHQNSSNASFPVNITVGRLWLDQSASLPVWLYLSLLGHNSAMLYMGESCNRPLSWHHGTTWAFAVNVHIMNCILNMDTIKSFISLAGNGCVEMSNIWPLLCKQYCGSK